MRLVVIVSTIDNASGAVESEEAGEYVIFSRTANRANRIFGQFWLNRDHIPIEWVGEDWKVFSLLGNREQLRSAMTGHLEGLGVFDEIKGWTIIPPPEPLAL